MEKYFGAGAIIISFISLNAGVAALPARAAAICSLGHKYVVLVNDKKIEGPMGSGFDNFIKYKLSNPDPMNPLPGVPSIY